jgi:hypothetical protein
MKTKNKYKHILSILLILAFGSSCRKEYEVCIDGYVRSSNDSRGVEGATVRLTSHTSDLLGGSGGGSIVQTQVTDASGKYSFIYKKNKKLSYRVSSVHPKYFSDPNRNERVLTTSKKQEVESLYLIPEAWVKLYAKRVSKGLKCYFISTINSTTSYDTSGVENLILKDRFPSNQNQLDYIVRFNSLNGPFDQGFKKNIVLRVFDTTDVRIEW